MRLQRLLTLVVCLGAAGQTLGTPTLTPLRAWASGTYLSRSSDDKAVHSVQALDELFALIAGVGGSTATLAGLLDAQQWGEQRPDAVVVVASGAEDASPAVAQKLAELSGEAVSHLHLPNAVHEGASHPVFAGLRRSARHLHVRVLGSCGPSLTAAGPATADALRGELAAAAGSDKPLLIILCPSAGQTSDLGAGQSSEAELLGAASELLRELAPRHLLVHAAHAGSAAVGAQQRQEFATGRHLLAENKSSAKNRTQDYTVCDATCQKHVMWMQGLIIAVVLLMALCVGCTCMHIIDVPTRFPQPEASRQHHD